MLPFYEHVPAPDRSSFRYRQFDYRCFPFRWHHHPEIELTLITSGRGQRFVGDHIAPFEPGDLVLLGEHLPHTWHSQPTRHERSRSVVIQFQRDFLGDGFLDTPEAQPIVRLLIRAAVGLRFTGAAAKQAAEAMLALHRVQGMRRLTGFLDLLAELARVRSPEPISSPGFRPPLRRLDERRLDRAVRLIHERLAEDLTQNQVAHALRLTPAGFSRFFKRNTGRTFIDYVHELRVGHACRLLIETDLPVTDVCYTSGFGNLSNFNRVFRRLKATTPRAFRNAFTDRVA